jgi:hypothetical protein
LAAKLMQRKGAPKSLKPINQGGTRVLAARIETLEKLVQRGALTRDELASLRVPFLSEGSGPDPDAHGSGRSS